MTPRELANLIRIGAKKRPQCAGRLFKNGASCALGAAYEGLTGKSCATDDYAALYSALPILGKFDGNTTQIVKDIWDMNDSQSKTREQIADWLDKLEPAQTFENFMEATLKSVDIAPAELSHDPHGF